MARRPSLPVARLTRPLPRASRFRWLSVERWWEAGTVFAVPSPSAGRPLPEAQRLSQLLSKRELAEVLAFCDACHLCASEVEFHRLLGELASFMGFEFVLYAHMDSTYDVQRQVRLLNVSNPERWMTEYAEHGYLEHDPVRRDLERCLARSEPHGVIDWQASRATNAIEREIVSRRAHHGLRYGMSAFFNSARQEAVFLVSFASETTVPESHRTLMARLIVPHLTRCRKRLDLSQRVARFSAREQVVAEWLVNGKTNQEIAEILEVTVATSKFHVANILHKLEVESRQQAVSVLVAERSLS